MVDRMEARMMEQQLQKLRLKLKLRHRQLLKHRLSSRLLKSIRENKRKKLGGRQRLRKEKRPRWNSKDLKLKLTRGSKRSL